MYGETGKQVHSAALWDTLLYFTLIGTYDAISLCESAFLSLWILDFLTNITTRNNTAFTTNLSLDVFSLSNVILVKCFYLLLQLVSFHCNRRGLPRLDWGRRRLDLLNTKLSRHHHISYWLILQQHKHSSAFLIRTVRVRSTQ